MEPVTDEWNPMDILTQPPVVVYDSPPTTTLVRGLIMRPMIHVEVHMTLNEALRLGRWRSITRRFHD